MQITFGQQYNVGEKPTVILYIHRTLIAMQEHQKLFPDPRFLLFVLQNIAGYKNAVECLLQ